MEDLNNKQEFIRFAQIIDVIKENKSDKGFQISFSDMSYISQIINKYMSDPIYLELLNKIMNASRGEEIKIIEEFYKEQALKEQKNEKPEEEIARAFGISADRISHLFLKNGKEIFHFYSEELKKDVVLENGKKGKSIDEALKEIQENNEKYTSDNPEENANNIMMDERLNNNLELNMYSPDEVMNHTAEISSLTEYEKTLLMYLLKNQEELKIKEINIENLFYITDNHEIKEIVFNKDFKPVVESPQGENNTNEEVNQDSTEIVEEEKEEKEEEANQDSTVIVEEEKEEENQNTNEKKQGEEDNYNKNSSQELNDMFSSDSNNYQNIDHKEDIMKKNDVKKLVYKKDDEKGYIGYISLIAIISLFVTIGIVLLKILRLL